MPKFKLIIMYDGTDFHGWQIQPDVRTVQGTIEKILSKIEGKSVRCEGASRTDTGVHALGQVCSVSLTRITTEEKLWEVLNKALPPDIGVKHIETVEENFSPRKMAIKKRYSYRFFIGKIRDPFITRYSLYLNKVPDIELLQKSAQYYKGTYDYRAFGAKNENRNTIKTIYLSEITIKGDFIIFTVEGDSFLYKMVRTMAGLLLNIGYKKVKEDIIKEMLGEKKRSSYAIVLPGKGLFLEKVFYPNEK